MKALIIFKFSYEILKNLLLYTNTIFLHFYISKDDEQNVYLE